MEQELRHLFIEIKKKDGNYDATLSDDSIDRDGEFFSPTLLARWAQDGSPIPFLADHENSMKSLLGAWTNRRLIQENGNTALKMQPKFFTEKANPLAQQIKAQIDEATDMGLPVGLSIGFIPKENERINGRLMFTDAELVEGSAIPVASNRHASISLAKAFMLQKDSLKKTSAVRGAGDRMEELALEQKLANYEKDNKELKEKLAAYESEKDSIEAAKKELESLRAKKTELETNEKKLQEDLTAERKKLEEATGKLNASRGKVPGAMLGVGKEKTGEQAENEEKFNATKAYLKLRGIEVPE